MSRRVPHANSIRLLTVQNIPELLCISPQDVHRQTFYFILSVAASVSFPPPRVCVSRRVFICRHQTMNYPILTNARVRVRACLCARAFELRAWVVALTFFPPTKISLKSKLLPLQYQLTSQ